jgi:hypothetical protein
MLVMALCPALCAASCDDDSDTGDGSSTDFAAACQRYAQAFCTKFPSCFPDSALFWDDPAECTARYADTCETYMELDDVLATPADLESCALAYEESTCDALLNVVLGQCLPPLKGARPDGAPCATLAQCQGGWCDFGTDGDRCGVCITMAEEGEPCGDGCSPYLTCGPDMTCAPIEYHALGEACGGTAGPCGIQLACIDGVCVERLGMGEACTVSIECQSDLLCDTASMTCTPRPPRAAVGEACGMNNVQCVSSAYCEQGICQAKVPDGGSCTDSDECMFAASCDAGTCTLAPPDCG